MKLYARVNILGGRAVRLPRGNINDAIALEADPVARARGWAEKGVDRLLVVDLDAAAYGDYRNRPMIHDLIGAMSIPVIVTGGVRSPAEATRLLEAGAWRVAMGTVAIEEQVLIWELCREYPDKIMVSLDVLPDEQLVVRGWTVHSGRFLEEVLIELSSAGVAAFMVSEAGRNALVEPPNFGILRHALEYVDEPVIAAGGVRNLEDLRALQELRVDDKGLFGVVVGREVTEGRFTIEEAKALIGDEA